MEINLTFGKDIFTILLISDTHLYQKGHHLPDHVMHAFREAQPDIILHCGDICTMELLDELKTIAPVLAVRGNRDILIRNRLPAEIDLKTERFRIHMEHGQGGIIKYLSVKTDFFLRKILKQSPDYSRAVTIKNSFSDYDLYCFGHSHSRSLCRKGKTILINPGHLNFEKPEQEHEPPSFAVVTAAPDSINISVNIADRGKISSETFTYYLPL